MAVTALSSKLVAEFLGTFLLVFTIGCNTLGKTKVWAPVSIASVLMVSIYSLGGISGAHFNPAVSFSLWFSKLMRGPGVDRDTCFMYCASQVLGGLTAACCYINLFDDAFNLGPGKGFGLVGVGLCETIYTFMLCFVVLNVAAARKYSEVEGNQWYGLAIGFVIVAGAYGSGAVSGGCFNPAVSIAIDLSSSLAKAEFGRLFPGFGWCVTYTCFQLLGALIAAVSFRYVRPNDFGAEPSALFPNFPKVFSEFLGTFILVFTVGLNVLGNSPAGAFSIAASLMCMIYAIGDVSGAHFNPAVTLAIYISRWTSLAMTDALAYMLSQLLGGFAGAFAYAWVHDGFTFKLGPMPGHTWANVGVAEMFFTMVLCYVVLAVAVSDRTESKSMFGLAIGSCITVGGFAAGNISGGCLNPAVSAGIASAQVLNGGYFYKALIYSGFEFAGAGVAAGLAMLTHADKQPLLGAHSC